MLGTGVLAKKELAKHTENSRNKRLKFWIKGQIYTMVGPKNNRSRFNDQLFFIFYKYHSGEYLHLYKIQNIAPTSSHVCNSQFGLSAGR